MKSKNSLPETHFNFNSHEMLLKANTELISQLQGRLRAKRFRVMEGDSIKLAYYRVLIQALTSQNAILKDAELDEINKRLEALESSQASKNAT